MKIAELTTICSFLILVFLAGCSTTRHRAAADREVYEIIEQRVTDVPGMETEFSIERQEPQTEALPLVAEADVKEYFGDAGPEEIGSGIISLNQALDIAVKNSREYQSEKERLYLAALNFTEIRQQYRPVLSGGRVKTDFSAQAVDVTKKSAYAQLATIAPELVTDLGTLTGTSSSLLNNYVNAVNAAVDLTNADSTHNATVQRRSGSAGTSFNVGMLMKSGARIAVSLTTNFFRYFSGDPAKSATSALVATIDQPLMGSQRRAAAETITQAERNLIYSIRSFVRFRKSFSVDIASDYYRVLRGRDTVQNNYADYRMRLLDLERDQEQYDAGRIVEADLGQTQEGVFKAENNWVTSIQQYQDDLDSFKMSLGLATDAKVVLDDREFEALKIAGLGEQVELAARDAVKIAMVARLDHYNELEHVEDVERRLKLAEDGILPDISLSLQASVNGRGATQFEQLDFKHYTWGVGLAFDPKIDRRAFRNEYRTALINVDAAQRRLEQFEDNVKLQVRRSWRAREQARFTYGIKKSSLKLSERRVLEQSIKFEEGMGDVLDRINAQDDLTDARNEVSQALVDYTTASLRLWRDMGILYIKDNGQWKEVSHGSQHEEQ